jgi:uncharacterized membrane protein
VDQRVRELAEKLLQSGYDDLSPREQKVLGQIAARSTISRNLSVADREPTFGERVADRVASFGGSWTFIFLFGGVIVGWIALNAWLLTGPPDPFPFILLNLLLSMVAALQAPVIMMSQNRQAAKDRDAAEHDYEVNLKAELEIMSLHEKLDDLRMRQLHDHFQRLEDRLAGLEARGQP